MFDLIEKYWNAEWEPAMVFELFNQGLTLGVGFTAILAALGVVACSSPIYSALYLIGHMVCLALLFLLYNAEFIAAVQVVVYAGAVMILFLFIIALLGAKKEDLKLTDITFEKFLAGSFVGTLFCELLMTLAVGETRPPKGEITQEVLQQVGSAKAIGLTLFSKHLIPFELASALLLVATVGIICLAKFQIPKLRRRSE